MNFVSAKPFRCLTVLVTVLSWLAVSNHCALASVVSSREAKICDHCSDNTDKHDGNKSAPQSMMACCKVLKVTDEGKTVWKSFTLVTGAFDYAALAEHNLSLAHIFPVSCRATGPPGSAGSTTLDLQHCHPGNAPPLV